MKYSYIFIVLAVTLKMISPLFSVSLKGSCSPPDNWYKETISPQKLSGSWYQVGSSLDYDGENTYQRCTIWDIVPNIGGKGWTWIEAGLEKFHSMELYSRFWPAKLDEPGTYLNYIVNNGEVMSFRKEYLLAIDYDRYSVGWTCRDNPYDGTYYGNLWIYSRGPRLCDSDWKAILEAIKNAAIIDRISTNVLMTDQSNCPKKQIRDELAKLDAEFST